MRNKIQTPIKSWGFLFYKIFINMKKTIKLTEADLTRIVKRVIKESEESNFMFYMEELGEYANQLDWEGLDIEGEEMEHFVDDIYQIVHNAKQDDTLTEDEIDEIEGFAAGIVSRLD